MEWAALHENELTKTTLEKIRALHDMAQARGQKLAQMALAWVLRKREVTTVLVDASSVEQLQANIDTLKTLEFTKDELEQIETILNQ